MAVQRRLLLLCVMVSFYLKERGKTSSDPRFPDLELVGRAIGPYELVR